MFLLDNAIAILFLSFLVGVVADALLRLMTPYDWLSSRYLFSNAKTYENLGVLWFRKVLLATPLRLFNTNICLRKNRELESLKKVREHIATAEISHWVGFVAMLGLTVIAWSYNGSKVGLAHLVFNIVGNLYPCLLQQYNKRRLCHLITILEKRDASKRAFTEWG